MSDRQDQPPCLSPPVTGLLEIGTLDQVPPGAALHVEVGDAELALINLDGHVVAVGDLCLRCGTRLSITALAGAQLTCSGCGWQYDVEQGCVVGLPALAIEKHEVRVDGGHLFVAAATFKSRASMP
jgi:nitrite reductase/ring-hydroxylating ferredoxin subunit